MKCMKIINSLFPKLKIASFVSEPEYSDNARALFEYLEKNEDKGLFKNHKFVWHIDSMNTELISRVTKSYRNVIFVKRKSLKGILYYMLSDIIVTTHGQYCKVIPTVKKQIHVLVWHGMPLKRIGYLFPKDEKDGIPQADYYIATSELFQKLMMQIFKASKEQVLLCGQPRNDVLFREPLKQKLAKIYAFGEKIILYLPTYRVSNISDIYDGETISDSQICFGGNQSDWENLNEVLQKNKTTIVVKPHPLEKTPCPEWIYSFSNIEIINDKWLGDNDISLYEMLAVSEKLITDYSSVYVDYLLLNRPIAFYILDYEKYKDSRGFVFENPLEYLPGKVFCNFNGISEFVVEEDNFEQQRAKINNLFNQIKSPIACRTLIEKLK